MRQPHPGFYRAVAVDFDGTLAVGGRAPDDEVHRAALALAGEIAANSPVAVQGTKAVLAASADRSVADGLDYVATWNAGMLASDDLTEALTAFIEKRPANFTGR